MPDTEMTLANGHVARKGGVTPMGNVLWKVFDGDVLMDIFWTRKDTPLAEVREKAERVTCRGLPLNGLLNEEFIRDFRGETHER
jgi:hypothetical protein